VLSLNSQNLLICVPVYNSWGSGEGDCMLNDFFFCPNEHEKDAYLNLKRTGKGIPSPTNNKKALLQES
jgi:hypothetical protein